MCCKNSDNQNRLDGSVKKVEAVKDLILFFGTLVKASVEGVVEFWGKDKTEAQSPAEPVCVPEVNEADLYVEVEETPVCEGLIEENMSAPTVKELKAQMKQMKREQKLAQKEEKRALKAEKKEEQLLKKQENQLEKEEKKQRNSEKKLERKLAREEKKQAKAEKKDPKSVRRVKYIAKDMVLSKTEKKFYDEIRRAAGLGYIVKPRVELADVLLHEDGTSCEDEDLGEMDFGVFDLRYRLRFFVEVKGMRRQEQQSQKAYREAEKLCRETSIPVIVFQTKHGKRPNYIKKRVQDFLNIR